MHHHVAIVRIASPFISVSILLLLIILDRFQIEIEVQVKIIEVLAMNQQIQHVVALTKREKR